MQIRSAEFVKSAVSREQYPDTELPEIAFAGRSNVGKSSLINTLVNRKRLVKTGSTPGRTQLLNFFVINDRLSFVDLPGYGYARVPAAIRKKWGPMIETYLRTREPLRGVVLIMDIRRVPGEEELRFLEWLSLRGLPCLRVITKADKLSKNKQNQQLARIRGALATAGGNPGLHLFSSKTRKGREALWSAITDLAGGETTEAT